MIPGLDSSIAAPGPNQAQAAATAGVPLWSGYLATRSGVGLLATWTQAAFDNARLAGTSDPSSSTVITIVSSPPSSFVHWP